MSINSINPLIPQIPHIKPIQETVPASPQGTKASGGFGEVFENVLKEVNNLQNEADQQIEGLTLKKQGFTPHTAMVALEKADFGSKLMSAIRGKIVRAYEAVTRTQV